MNRINAILSSGTRRLARGFILSAGAIFLFAALSKLANFPWKPGLLHMPFDLSDPVFGIPIQWILFMGITLQLAGALLCLFTKRTAAALLFVAWLTLNFFIYRIGLWINGWHHPVSGVFYLGAAFGFSPRSADILAIVAVIYLFLGSLAALWGLRLMVEEARFLRAFCPACGGHVKFLIQNRGQQINCPHCQKTMMLRSVGETIKMTCGSCDGNIEFSAHSLGERIPCPHCKKTITLSNEVSAQRAFTLIELLVVISILAILAALLLPVLSRAKEKGRQAFCQSNLHQIAVGFQLYIQESDDEFPAPGSKTEYGPQPEDWIWWEQGRDVNKSAIAPHMAGFSAKVFTCPSDLQAQLLQEQGTSTNDAYRYSYSLTSYSLTEDKANPGMSTIITKAREVYPFKSSQIRRVGDKIMLVEEDRASINDSRWLPVANPESASPTYNLIAARHGKKGDVLFTDSHIEAELPQFGQDPINSMPSY